MDPRDDFSTLLLLLVDGEPAGSVRITERRHGPLELEEYTEVMPWLPPTAKPAELNRFMVTAPHRRTLAGPMLLYGAVKVLTLTSSDHLVAASKVGSLNSYYRNASSAPCMWGRRRRSDVAS